MVMRVLMIAVMAVTATGAVYSDEEADEAAVEVIRGFQRYTYREAFPRGDGDDGYRYRVAVTEAGERGQQARESEVIVSPGEQAAVIFFENRLQEMIILRRFDSESAWMISSRARRPLMITANRNVVSNYNVEDLTGADFANDYRIERVIDENTVMLEALDRKPAFPYVSLRRIDEGSYVARYYSRNRKPIKEIRYSLGTVDGLRFWSDFLVTDLVFKDVPDVRMTTVAVRFVSVPRSLFYPNTMNRFFAIFD